MARILLITYFFPPFNSVGCRRVYAWSKYLTAFGHEITVVTADLPEEESAKTFDVDISFCDVHRLPYRDIRTVGKRMLGIEGSISKSVHVESTRNIKTIIAERIVRIASYISRRGVLYGQTRLPSFSDPWFSCAYKEAEGIIQEKYIDVIITSSPPPVVHRIGAALKRGFPEIPWIADFRDLWTQHPNQKGIFPFTLYERIVEKCCLRVADALITVTEGFRKALERKYANKETFLIENGYDFDDDLSPAATPVPTAMFLGTLYSTRHDLMPLLDAVKQLNDEGRLEMRIEFYGPYITELIVENALQKCPSILGKVAFKGFLPYGSVIQKYKEASALLFFETDKHNDGVFTGKIYEYIATKKPILCIGIDEGSSISEFLKATGICFLCGNDVEQIKDFLLKLQNGEIRVTPDDEFISRFSRKKQVEKVNGIIASHVK
ncbi:hypothetical protein ACFL38_03380 [Candidatus Omnitrophota bacterium]